MSLRLNVLLGRIDLRLSFQRRCFHQSTSRPRRRSASTCYQCGSPRRRGDRM